MRRPGARSWIGLPFAKTIGDELYFAPESGRLFASPMDEVPSEPCDAQPDEYEIALAAHRMEQRTTVTVGRIHSRWAGLRTFTLDRHPAAGFAPDSDGFFWLAGQGGFGLRTSPAMAAIASIADCLTSLGPWPALSRRILSPGSLLSGRRHRSTQRSPTNANRRWVVTSTEVLSDPPAGKTTSNALSDTSR